MQINLALFSLSNTSARVYVPFVQLFGRIHAEKQSDVPLSTSST